MSDNEDYRTLSTKLAEADHNMLYLLCQLLDYLSNWQSQSTTSCVKHDKFNPKTSQNMTDNKWHSGIAK